MAKSKQLKLLVKDELTEAVNTFADLLDPHLQSGREENVAREERWPLRKTVLYVGGASVILWGLIVAIFWFLFIR
jgi:hypothetical protein